MVTSTVPNEGKSTITAQLAQAIAAGGKNVLVVECNMRKRSLAGILNVHPEVGLHAVLADEEPLNQAIVALPQQACISWTPSRTFPTRPTCFPRSASAASLAW